MHCTIDYTAGTITVSKNGEDLATYNTTDLRDIPVETLLPTGRTNSRSDGVAECEQ